MVELGYRLFLMGPAPKSYVPLTRSEWEVSSPSLYR